MILLSAIALFLVIALASYAPQDPGWSHTGSGQAIFNKGGVVGAWLADVLLYLFGYMAFIFPLMVAFSAWLVFRGRGRIQRVDYFHISARAIGFVLTITMGCALAWLRLGNGLNLPQNAGGIVGDVCGSLLLDIFGGPGGVLLMLALFLTGITLFTGLSWLRLMDMIGRYALGGFGLLADYWGRMREARSGNLARREREAVVRVESKKVARRPKPRIEPTIGGLERGERAEKEKQAVLFDALGDSAVPPLGLLDPPPPSKGGYSTEALEALSRLVELKLADFGVSVEVVAVHPGPVITRFELQPAAGVKVSQISNLAKDLARSLSTISVRVVDVIPGKSVIGLEIPNEQRDLVSLSEIMNSREFDASHAPLTLALGKDIGGKSMVVDLARMPHLLVAGTTGSGKSVAINAMILSLLYKSSATDVRLIMIDPKMLELSVYEGIPALLAPVVTDMKEAANALRWCVAEMERRYKLMAALGVRNISGCNRKVREARKKKQPLLDPLYVAAEGEEGAPELEPLPYIVVFIDELADMMMVVGKKVEELIARLAQKARASGIHLVLATQRPSVDVITGLIKANIPTRIAFQVSSKVDSRTILDQIGAEHLLGHGDMLYLAPGTGIPLRIHGAFVSDQEVHQVVEYLKQRGEANYIEAVLAGTGEGAQDAIPGLEPADEEMDPLYDQAVRIVTETRRASISGVQRRLKIGYNRAARMIEEMERSGVVGELQTNGSREVLAPPPPKD